MTGFDVYLITRCGAIQALFIVVAIVSGVLGIIALAIEVLDEDNELPPLKKWIAASCIICGISSVGAVLMPDTKEAAAIYLLPKIANNEQVGAIPSKTLSVLEGKLDEWIKDMGKDDD